MRESALVPIAAAQVREENVIPVVAVREAEGVAGGEPAERLVLPEQAGLRGERAVQHDLLAHVALAAEDIEVPEIDVLADERLGRRAPGLLRQLPQFARRGRVGELPAHLLQLFRVHHQAVGWLEGRLKLCRLQVLFPALVVAGPLLEMEGQARGALQAEPHQPARTGDRVRVAHLDRE
jgi:hypothetical protein